jgi:hypothetical protein
MVRSFSGGTILPAEAHLKLIWTAMTCHEHLAIAGGFMDQKHRSIRQIVSEPEEVLAAAISAP